MLSADEKTSIQTRRRIHAALPPAPGRVARVEHECKRRGAWAYLAAWDVDRAEVFGRCETATGIASLRVWWTFSIVQRKVLTPNDFSCLADLEAALLAFQ